MIRRPFLAVIAAFAFTACTPPGATGSLPAAPPWPKPADTAAKAAAAGVATLPNGHASLAMHIHPTINVFYNGERVTIPAEVGIDGSTMTEIHTHDASGRVHLESVTQKDFRLGQFFAVWGVPLAGASAYVDGKQVADPANLVMTDNQAITVSFGPLPSAALR